MNLYRTSMINKKELILFSFILCLSFFVYSGNNNIFIFISILCFCLLTFFNNYRQKAKVEYILLKLAIYCLPFSFLNIFGGKYSTLPLSWFFLFLCLLYFSVLIGILRKKEIKVNILFLLSVLILATCIVPLIISVDLISATKQYINVLMFMLTFIIGTNILLEEEEISDLFKIYIFVVVTVAFGVLLQYFLINYLGIERGIFIPLNQRMMYGFLFNDFSFLSLYLASGALLLFSLVNSGQKSKLHIIIAIIILISSVLVSARTGVVSAVFVLILWYFIKIFRDLYYGKINGIITFIIFVLISILLFGFLGKVRTSDLLDDSNRMDLIQISLQHFFENPLWGIGFGVDTVPIITGHAIPHNLIIQHLLQSGLLITTLILLLLFMLLVQTFKHAKDLFPTLLCILIGAQFIPDIFNSRYLIIICLLSVIIFRNKFNNNLIKL